jgi:hypothetical protein
VQFSRGFAISKFIKPGTRTGPYRELALTGHPPFIIGRELTVHRLYSCCLPVPVPGIVIVLYDAAYDYDAFIYVRI